MPTFNLEQLIKQPTRITEASKTLLDVILAVNTGSVRKTGVMPCSISDHDLVDVEIYLKKDRAKPIYFTTRSFKNYDQVAFEEDMSKVPWSVVDVFDDVDDKLNVFHLLFNQILDLHAPVKSIKIRSRPNPFITDEIRTLMKVRNKWRKLDRTPLKQL